MPMKHEDVLGDLSARTGRAVTHYWKTRTGPQDKQRETGKADQGLRRLQPPGQGAGTAFQRLSRIRRRFVHAPL